VSALVSCFLYEDSICLTPIFEPTIHKLVVHVASFNLEVHCLIQYLVPKRRWERELRLQHSIWSDSTILHARRKYPRRRHVLYLKCSPQVRINPELFKQELSLPDYLPVCFGCSATEWLLHYEFKMWKTKRMVDVVCMSEQSFCSSFNLCHFSCDTIQDADISSTSNAALKCVSVLNYLLQGLILPHHISCLLANLWNNELKLCQTRQMIGCIRHCTTVMISLDSCNISWDPFLENYDIQIWSGTTTVLDTVDPEDKARSVSHCIEDQTIPPSSSSCGTMLLRFTIFSPLKEENSSANVMPALVCMSLLAWFFAYALHFGLCDASENLQVRFC